MSYSFFCFFREELGGLKKCFEIGENKKVWNMRCSTLRYWHTYQKKQARPHYTDV